MALVVDEGARVGHGPLPILRRAEQLMAMPAVRKSGWTLEEFERLVDERDGLTPRYELVDGDLLVTPAPSGRHQRIVGQLYFLLRPYVARHGLGELRLGPATVSLTRDSRFEPDLFVIPSVGGRRPRANDPVTQVLLAIEVLSPGSARHDRITKRRFFQRQGVPEYWIVDGEAEAFEIWHPADERAALVDDLVHWRPAGASEPFDLDVPLFFADVADDVT
jgi:Uma2 family endonuclease